MKETSSASKKVVEGKEAEKLNQIYQDAFVSAARKTPCLQSYHSDEFLQVLRDEEIIKLISYLDGEPVGMALITSNLNKVPWINKEFYRYNFPEQFEKGVVFYVKSILVAPEVQNIITGEEQTRVITKLIKMIEDFLPEDAIFCYDNSMALNGWFTRFLVETTPSVHPLFDNWNEGMDRQVYFAFRKNYREGYGEKIKRSAKK